MAKQLVAQCSNIRKKELLSWLEIDEVQHNATASGTRTTGQGGDIIITPTRVWVPSPKCDGRRRIVRGTDLKDGIMAKLETWTLRSLLPRLREVPPEDLLDDVNAALPQLPRLTS